MRGGERDWDVLTPLQDGEGRGTEEEAGGPLLHCRKGQTLSCTCLSP